MILLNNENIIEKNIKIEGIPCILFTPKNKKEEIATVIYYHGWSSNKDRERFRGMILANLGYQVIIPDSIYHGERNPIDHKDTIVKYFWKVVLNNIDESNYIIDEAIRKYQADSNSIGVTGHSMGGFTTAGIFTHNNKVKTGIPLNGSFNWEMSNELFAKNLEDNTILKEEDKIKKLDPINNINKLVNRPILMLNGEADQVVPMDPQKKFYEKIRRSYINKSHIKMIRYPNLGHFVTTNMMEDLGKWLSIHLK